MKAGESQIEVGANIKVVRNTHGERNDDCLIGVEGTATHPFANGCTDPGWIGLRANRYTAYGYQFNIHETEVQIIHP
jgi:hypothetical protein